jgi:hypothetical protein
MNNLHKNVRDNCSFNFAEGTENFLIWIPEMAFTAFWDTHNQKTQNSAS